MEIKTKFDIGEEVWTIERCMPVKLTIISITVNARSTVYCGNIQSHPEGYGIQHKYVSEPECFRSQEDLLEYIISKQTSNTYKQ
jgi:hypothetical protein